MVTPQEHTSQGSSQQGWRGLLHPREVIRPYPKFEKCRARHILEQTSNMSNVAACGLQEKRTARYPLASWQHKSLGAPVQC